MAAFMQWLPNAFAGRAIRSTDGTVYCVTEGTGTLTRTPVSLTQAAEINIRLGFDHLRNGRRADAVTKFERAIAEDPKNPNGFLGLAMINEQVADVKEARRRYEQAIDVGAADPSVRNVYGAFLCKTGETKRAEEQFMLASKTLKYDTPEIAGLAVQVTLPVKPLSAALDAV